MLCKHLNPTGPPGSLQAWPGHSRPWKESDFFPLLSLHSRYASNQEVQPTRKQGEGGRVSYLSPFWGPSASHYERGMSPLRLSQLGDLSTHLCSGDCKHGMCLQTSFLPYKRSNSKSPRQFSVPYKSAPGEPHAPLCQVGSTSGPWLGVSPQGRIVISLQKSCCLCSSPALYWYFVWSQLQFRQVWQKQGKICLSLCPPAVPTWLQEQALCQTSVFLWLLGFLKQRVNLCKIQTMYTCTSILLEYYSQLVTLLFITIFNILNSLFCLSVSDGLFANWLGEILTCYPGVSNPGMDWLTGRLFLLKH